MTKILTSLIRKSLKFSRVVLPSILAVVAACGGDVEGERTVPADFEIRPGVEQVSVTDAAPNTPLTLYRAGGEKIVTLITDDFGQASFIFVPEEHGVYETGPDAPIPPGD